MIYRVYRIYDADKQLLYVGCSMSPIIRLISHKQTKPWFDKIKTVDFSNFNTKREALDAEIMAIKTESPIHNIVCATPEIAAARIAEKRQWVIDNLSDQWRWFKRIEWNIYYSTLKALVSEGLVERDGFNYRLTQAGNRIFNA